MKRTVEVCLFCIVIFACSHSKNIAQTTGRNENDRLANDINSSTADTANIIPHLKQLQQQNDLVIALGTLNYAWTRKGDFYVLTKRNGTWQLYRYGAKLPPSPNDLSMEITPQNVSPETAENIKKMYAGNITDAETWTISVATRQTIHTTTYYAPQFFEECCPGNAYRQRFTAIANEIIALGKNQSPYPEK